MPFISLVDVLLELAVLVLVFHGPMMVPIRFLVSIGMVFMGSLILSGMAGGWICVVGAFKSV